MCVAFENGWPSEAIASNAFVGILDISDKSSASTITSRNTKMMKMTLLHACEIATKYNCTLRHMTFTEHGQQISN
jgi:hypothetical protein